MQKNIWSRNFDWVKTGSTWIQQDRLETYNEKRFIAVGDIYFKLNKYLTGVTFNYINKLDDIYKRDLLTGDGYSLFNMYNEYDVIDWAMKNIQFVDIASKMNIDITKQWHKIDNIQLKPNHFILLYNQDSEFENDIYQVTPQYFLKNANLITTREKSDKFSVSVKMGTDRDKQFFLLNNGLNFPITNEPKYFIEGRSYILKNIIKYNLYNTSSNSAITSKIIFTDYDFVKKQFPDNYNLFASIDFNVLNSTSVSNNYFQLEYHHNIYTCRTGSTNSNIMNCNVSGITNINTFTNIPYSSFVINNGDYLGIRMFTGSTDNFLFMNTFVKSVSINSFIIEDTIPNQILTALSNATCEIINYSVATTWSEAINNFINYTPYSVFYSVSSTTVGISNSLHISTKSYKYDRFFDYDGLIFRFVDNNIISNFYSQNNYIKYKLYDRLSVINPSLFTNTFNFYNTEKLTGFTASFLPAPWSPTLDRVILTFPVSGLTSNFRPFTYAFVSGNTLEKTLIWEVNDTQIIIEKPINWSIGTSTIYYIQNIDGLKNVSDILYDLYFNVNYGWFVEKPSNIKGKICGAYAQILSENVDIRNNITGLLFENSFGEFQLKLYNFQNDYQLTFTSHELIYIGGDRKSRIPVPLKGLENLTNVFDLDWNVLDGGSDSSTDTNEVFVFGFDDVLGGPNDPPPIYTIVDGNDF